jgi:hypothetical protein
MKHRKQYLEYSKSLGNPYVMGNAIRAFNPDIKRTKMVLLEALLKWKEDNNLGEEE